MATNSFKIKNSTNLDPQTGSVVTTKGDIAYNGATDKLELYNGAVDPFVQEAKAATLTNKTISGGTISTTTVTATAFISATGAPATAGLLRLNGSAAIEWRNAANSGNVALDKDNNDSLGWNGNYFIDTSGNLTAPAIISSVGAPATAGFIRINGGGAIEWRNAANSGNVAMDKDGTDALGWNGTYFISAAGVLSGSNFSGSSSGSNTGDQTITLTGDVTGSGTGSFATAVAKIAGTTVSGTTGTTNVAFSASPTFTGTLNAAAITASGTVSTGPLVNISDPTASATRRLRFQDTQGSPNTHNFMIGVNFNLSDTLEITPSTANGGNTYSNPAVAITSTGALTLGQSATPQQHTLNTTTATNGVGVGTITNLPAGFSGNPTGYIQITINGGTHVIPYW